VMRVLNPTPSLVNLRGIALSDWERRSLWRTVCKHSFSRWPIFWSRQLLTHLKWRWGLISWLLPVNPIKPTLTRLRKPSGVSMLEKIRALTVSRTWLWSIFPSERNSSWPRFSIRFYSSITSPRLEARSIDLFP
jgi:hypothetical protein